MTPLLLTIPLIAAAPVPKDFKKETPRLNGKWQIIGLSINGQQVGQQPNSVWQFDENNVTINNTGRMNTIPIKTDSKTSPKEFQFNHVGNNNPQLGVYDIEGETLTICIGLRQGQRPVAANGGQNEIVYKFTRVKE